jgi:hypothetical protein
MCHCITPQALLSALVSRAAREGYEPTRADLEAVLAIGCSREEVLSRFEHVGPEASSRVRAALDALQAM